MSAYEETIDRYALCTWVICKKVSERIEYWWNLSFVWSSSQWRQLYDNWRKDKREIFITDVQFFPSFNLYLIMKIFVLGLNYWAHSAGIAERCACTPFIERPWFDSHLHRVWEFYDDFVVKSKYLGGLSADLPPSAKTKQPKSEIVISTWNQETESHIVNVKILKSYIYLTINLLTTRIRLLVLPFSCYTFPYKLVARIWR